MSEKSPARSMVIEPVIYAEVREDRNVQCSTEVKMRRRNVSQEATIPEVDSDDASMTSPSPTTVMLMQTPEQEETCSRHLVVANAAQPGTKKTNEKRKKTTSTSSSQPDQVFYTITSYDSTMEYRELDPKILSLHYGDVTPYGNVTPSYVETDGRTPSRISGAKSPTRDSTSSFGTSVYSSLIRTTDAGVKKVKLGQKGIYYIDFIPTRKNENFYKNDQYLGFEDCIEQANLWLSENKSAAVTRCESLRHRLDHSHQFNPESTASHDRSCIIGLRVWYYLEREEHDTKIAFRNFVPRGVKTGEKTVTTAVGLPPMENLTSTLKRMNEALQKDPLKGHLLDIETVAMNSALIYAPNGTIDANRCYCNLESQDKWEIFIFRLFFIEDASHKSSPHLEFRDFVAKPLSLPPSRVHFHTTSSLVSDANDWLNKQANKQICAVENVELTFKRDLLDLSKELVNTNSWCCRTSKSSAKRNCLKVLRIWLVDQPKNPGTHQPQGGAVGFDLLTFVPKQLTKAGCCGANKALFATSRDTVEKISDWMNRSGAEVVDIQTDNVEKWQASSADIHTYLPERTYNKEDYKNPVLRSALECRLTVFRVYYRPKSLGHLYTPGPDKPVEPCCCFVGCSIM